jgi:hypothetical protein
MIPEGFLALSGFELLGGEVRIRLQKWESATEQRLLVFPQANLSSINSFHEPDDSLEFPWDIVGLESDELENSRWQFTLVTQIVEISFESAWPTAVP